MNIGCHVSTYGGVWNAPKNAAVLGCECMQIFTRSPQGGPAPELDEEAVGKFRSELKKHKIKEIYVHTPYYINLASGNNRIRYGSAKIIRDELERASLIGARFVMTHLGSARDLGQAEAVKIIVEMLKKCLEGYEGSAQLLLENSAGTGQIIGDDLKELADTIENVASPAVAGICLDTQHSFASGYDWRDFKKTISRVDREIGMDKVKLIHANDSETGLGSNRDRHAHIGEGLIGVEAFRKITALAKKNGIDMVLETEHDKIREDIMTLKGLRDNFLNIKGLKSYLQN